MKKFWPGMAMAGALLAQDAVKVERVLPPKVPTQQDYERAAALLKQRPARKKAAPPASLMITGDITAVTGDKAIILPESAIQAIRLQSSWHNPEPMMSEDGSIVYIYGQGQPTIPFAVKKTAMIRLALGEVVGPNDVDMGDQTNWTLAKHQILQGGQVQTFITIKPNLAGLDTTLNVFTAEHAYSMRLLSDYQGVDKVAFQYPEDLAVKAAAEKKRQEEAQAQQRSTTIAQDARKQELQAADSNKPVTNTNYKISGGKHSKYILPVSVGDNGVHTQIQLGEQARNREVPALQIITAAGPSVPAWHFNATTLTFTVDGLFDRALLEEGQGKRRVVVTIDKVD